MQGARCQQDSVSVLPFVIERLLVAAQRRCSNACRWRKKNQIVSCHVSRVPCWTIARQPISAKQRLGEKESMVRSQRKCAAEHSGSLSANVQVVEVAEIEHSLRSPFLDHHWGVRARTEHQQKAEDTSNVCEASVSDFQSSSTRHGYVVFSAVSDVAPCWLKSKRTPTVTDSSWSACTAQAGIAILRT